VEDELARRLSADLEVVGGALVRAGAPPDLAGRLLEASSAAVASAVALAGLRHAADRAGETGGVDPLDR
jgi:hypothetical protein